LTEIFNKKSETKKRKELRHNMPKAEVVLWTQLKGKQIGGHKFRRQYGVGPYVLDFYCPKLKLAIEIDGDSHFQDGAEEYDKDRQELIETLGIRFLRFTNGDVHQSLDGVLEKIALAIRRIKETSP
jgi:very-short-patch-repair endonuclease